MFRDRTELTLFRAGTVPETVPVWSLMSSPPHSFDKGVMFSGCLFVRLDRYRYYDILWTPWTVLMEHSVAPTNKLQILEVKGQGHGRPSRTWRHLCRWWAIEVHLVVLTVNCKYNEDGNYFRNGIWIVTDIILQEWSNNWNYCQAWWKRKLL